MGMRSETVDDLSLSVTLLTIHSLIPSSACQRGCAVLDG